MGERFNIIDSSCHWRYQFNESWQAYQTTSFEHEFRKSSAGGWLKYKHARLLAGSIERKWIFWTPQFNQERHPNASGNFFCDAIDFIYIHVHIYIYIYILFTLGNWYCSTIWRWRRYPHTDDSFEWNKVI